MCRNYAAAAVLPPIFAAAPPPQYCNRGTIYDAIDRGWLRQERSLDSPPNLRTVLLTARVCWGWL